jgi:hypothetical protein
MHLTGLGAEFCVIQNKDTVKGLPESFAGEALLLRNDSRNIPIHLPQPRVAERLSGRHNFLSGSVLKGASVNVFSVNDGLPLGHDLGDHVLRHHRVAAGDVGAAALDAREGAIRTGLPVASLYLLQLGNQELIPDPY